MGPGGHDCAGQGSRGWAYLVRSGGDPGWRPIGVPAMSAGHVIGKRGMVAPARTPGMAGNPFALMEDLDGPVSDADIDEFADQAVGHGIPIAIDLDMIVGRHPATLPHREDVRFGRQRL